MNHTHTHTSHNPERVLRKDVTFWAFHIQYLASIVIQKKVTVPIFHNTCRYLKNEHPLAALTTEKKIHHKANEVLKINLKYLKGGVTDFEVNLKY